MLLYVAMGDWAKRGLCCHLNLDQSCGKNLIVSFVLVRLRLSADQLWDPKILPPNWIGSRPSIGVPMHRDSIATRIERFGDFKFPIPTVNGLVSGESTVFFPGFSQVIWRFPSFRDFQPRFVAAKLDFYGMGLGYPSLMNPRVFWRSNKSSEPPAI